MAAISRPQVNRWIILQFCGHEDQCHVNAENTLQMELLGERRVAAQIAWCHLASLKAALAFLPEVPNPCLSRCDGCRHDLTVAHLDEVKS